MATTTHAACMFTKVLAHMLALLHSQVIPIVGYMDDHLLRENSAQLLTDNIMQTVILLKRFDYIH